MRISPDGARIAYDERSNGEAITLGTPADATGPPAPDDDLADLVDPSWIGSDRLLLSRDVAAFGGSTFARFTIGGAEEDRFTSDQVPWASSFEGASTRDGTRLAELADDGLENAGVPTRVVLRRYAVVGDAVQDPRRVTVRAAAPGAAPVTRVIRAR